MSSSRVTTLCRSLLRQLQLSNPEHEVGTHPLWKYVTSELRRSQDHDGTEQKIALLEEYLVYLRNTREHRDLLSHYQGRGERSVEETAKLVGLALPENNLSKQTII